MVNPYKGDCFSILESLLSDRTSRNISLVDGFESPVLALYLSYNYIRFKLNSREKLFLFQIKTDKNVSEEYAGCLKKQF